MPLIPAVAPGQVISSSAWGNLVAPQTVMRFTTAAQRTSQLTAPILNQLTMLDTAPGRIDMWTGTAWAPATAGAELAYNQITADKTVNATSAATADLVVDGTATTYDGSSAVMVEFFAMQATPPNTSAAFLIIELLDATTDLGTFALIRQPAVATPGFTITLRGSRRLVPTAGTHTYRAAAWCSPAGPGSIVAGPGGAGLNEPCYLRVTRV